jgi:hypothetical protein
MTDPVILREIRDGAVALAATAWLMAALFHLDVLVTTGRASSSPASGTAPVPAPAPGPFDLAPAPVVMP